VRQRLGTAARRAAGDPERYARGLTTLETIYDEVMHA